MSAKIIDGKAVAEEIKTEIRAATDALAAAGRRRPGLAVVMVGNAAASEVYVRNKRRSCEQAGIISSAHDLSAGTSEAELLALIELLNNDSAIDGILVQLPLPAQIRPRSVIDAISPAKDVDGFHPYNLGRLAQREPLLRCCTPYGVMRLLDSIGAIGPIADHSSFRSCPRQRICSSPVLRLTHADQPAITLGIGGNK